MDPVYVHPVLVGALAIVCACGTDSGATSDGTFEGTSGGTSDATVDQTADVTAHETTGASAASTSASGSASTSASSASSDSTAPATGGETSGDASSSASTDASDSQTSDASASVGTSETATTADGTTGQLDPDEELLLSLPGPFFTASPEEPSRWYNDLGTPGAAYRRLELEFDVELAAFRDDIPPNNEERWDHVLFGLYRQGQPQSYLEYLIGASARIETNAADRAFNYGRVALEMGAASYKSWKKNYAWQEYTEVHVRQWIDADASEQTLELYKGDALDLTVTGPVDYFTPELTADQLKLELGTEDADWGLHVSPHGWTFKDLTLRGWLAP